MNRQPGLVVYLPATIIFNLNHELKQIIFPVLELLEILKKRSAYRKDVIKETELANLLSPSLTDIIMQLFNILFQFAFKTDYIKYILLSSVRNLSQNVFMRRSSYNLPLPSISCKQLEEMKVNMLERRKASNFELYSLENVGHLHQVRAKYDCIK